MHSEQENIARTLILHKVDWLGYRGGRLPKGSFTRYFFISIEGKDPSPSFLKQLGEHFVGDSLSMEDKNARNFKVSNIIHKQTRKPGMQIYVRDIKIITPNQATATCGWRSGGLSAERSDFQLRKVNSRWVILRRGNIRKA